MMPMIALENPHKSKGWIPHQINGNRIYVDNYIILFTAQNAI